MVGFGGQCACCTVARFVGVIGSVTKAGGVTAKANWPIAVGIDHGWNWGRATRSIPCGRPS